MINSNVRNAVAAILAVGSASAAHAIAISTVPSTNILYVSGSTAIDPGLRAYATNGTEKFCDASLGTINYYAGTASGHQFIAVACVAGAGATPVTSGTSIAFIKEDTAGSLNGITPVANASTLPYPDFNSLDANCTTPTAQPANEQAQTSFSCSSNYTNITKAPNFGFADVEAAIFGVSPGSTTASATIDLVFAPAVSLGLYHALQSVEGLTQNDDVTNMPTLSRGTLSAIFTGQLNSWANVQGSSGAAVSAQSVSFGNSNINASSQHICWDGTAFSTGADCQTGTQGPAHAAANSNIYICRRGNSSGTERTAEIYFGNLACAVGVLPFNNPGKPGLTCSTDGCGWSTTFNTVINFAGNGTGDLLSCLIAKDEQGEFAVGFASTDNGWGGYQGNVARKDFRYVRVNGVVPSIENVAANKYAYWAQSSDYVPASSASNFATGVAGNISSAFSNAATAIGNVGQITALNPALQYTLPAFDGGFLAIPVTGGATPNPATATLATFQGNPVNTFTRTNSVGQPNNCQIPYAAPQAPNVGELPVWTAPIL